VTVQVLGWAGNGETTMRCGLLPKTGENSKAGAPPDSTLMAAIGRLWEQAKDAAALVDTEERQPCSMGTRRRRPKGRAIVIDGPFIEAKELLGG
jgi:hypothetical protein